MKAEELAVIKLRADSLVTEKWYYSGDTICESEQGNPVITANNWGDIQMSQVVGEFIANARQDIPKLVAEVERQDAEIADREESHIAMYNENRELQDEVKRLQTVVDVFSQALEEIAYASDTMTLAEHSLLSLKTALRALGGDE